MNKLTNAEIAARISAAPVSSTDQAREGGVSNVAVAYARLDPKRDLALAEIARQVAAGELVEILPVSAAGDTEHEPAAVLGRVFAASSERRQRDGSPRAVDRHRGVKVQVGLDGIIAAAEASASVRMMIRSTVGAVLSADLDTTALNDLVARAALARGIRPGSADKTLDADAFTSATRIARAKAKGVDQVEVIAAAHDRLLTESAPIAARAGRFSDMLAAAVSVAADSQVAQVEGVEDFELRRVATLVGRTGWQSKAVVDTVRAVAARAGWDVAASSFLLNARTEGGRVVAEILSPIAEGEAPLEARLGRTAVFAVADQHVTAPLASGMISASAARKIDADRRPYAQSIDTEDREEIVADPFKVDPAVITELADDATAGAVESMRDLLKAATEAGLDTASMLADAINAASGRSKAIVSADDLRIVLAEGKDGTPSDVRKRVRSRIREAIVYRRKTSAGSSAAFDFVAVAAQIA